MDAEPIESEALDLVVVDMFMEFVYTAMCKVDSASYVADVFMSVVDCLADLGLPAAEVSRYRSTVERATALVTRMDSAAVASASLAPAHLQSAAFDSALSGYETTWISAARHVGQIDAA